MRTFVFTNVHTPNSKTPFATIKILTVKNIKYKNELLSCITLFIIFENLP